MTLPSNPPNPARTDRRGQRDHIHALVREEYQDSTGKYRYRCLTCGNRFKLMTGVLVKQKETK